MNQDLPTIITGTPGDDTLVGTPGIDLLIGLQDDDVLEGGEGHDFLLGDEGNDILGGGDGHDFLIGGEGNDRLEGGNGHDLLIGDEGNDHLYGGAGVDFYDGGEGFDTVDFQENFAITADLSQGRATYINEAGVEVVETLLNVERLVGSALDDQLIGNEENNNLVGGDGNDTLVGGQGDDMLRGDAGADFIDGGEGLDTVYFQENFAITADLSQGIATYINSAGVEEIETFTNVETLVGAALDDRLIGDATDNTLWGLEGNDRLIGGAGDDGLFGGAGVDFFDGGEGNDIVYFKENFAISADLSQGIATYIDDTGVEVVEILLNVEGLGGTTLDDQLIGDAANNTLRGLEGNDILIGSAGADIFGFLSLNQGVDTIVDFNSAEGDIIQISATGFGAGLTPGVLNPDQFTIGSTAADGGDRIIYNDATGALSFDPDGTGTLGQVQFARLFDNPVLTSSDIVVV